MFQNPPKWPKMHLEAFSEPLRRGLPVISLGLTLKFWSKIDIFHRYHIPYTVIFWKFFQNPTKIEFFGQISWENHVFTLYACFLMKFDQKIRFLADFKKFSKNHCILYWYLWNISIFDQNLRAKSREITGSSRLRSSKNASKCIFGSFWGFGTWFTRSE